MRVAIRVNRLTVTPTVAVTHNLNLSFWNMRTQSVKHLVRLVCGAFLLSLGTPIEASERRFRLKIPNPIPRIVDRIEKVGDFVGRTARRIGRDDDENERRRTPPPIPDPVSLPSEDITVVRPGDARSLERNSNAPMQGGNARPAMERSPETPQLATPSKIVVVSPSAGTVKTKRSNETATPAADAVVSSALATDLASAGSPLSDGAGASLDSAQPEPALLTFGRSVPGRPGLVYPPGVKAVPENRVDVRGIPPGTKVRDPSTGQIFLVP